MDIPVVLVTGSGRGIGRAICRRFAPEGAQMVAVSRSIDELNETRRLVESDGGKCDVHRADVCEVDQVNGFIESTVNRFGRVDALVNCAGVAWVGSLEELDAGAFDLVLGVNVRAVYHTSRAVWSVMKSRGGGVIVNISSVASVDPFPGLGVYGAAKAWVNTWTKALADEGRACGIKVFAVAPGAVETAMLRGAFPDFPAEQTLQPEDVAAVVYTLARPDCQYMSGQTVFVRK
ncbi:MAG: SDR family NAD(P)-dependent oxidoreductase [Planctomycetota bacterium]